MEDMRESYDLNTKTLKMTIDDLRKDQKSLQEQLEKVTKERDDLNARDYLVLAFREAMKRPTS